MEKVVYLYCAYPNRREYARNFRSDDYRKSHKTEIPLARVDNDNFTNRERQIFCMGMTYGLASRFKHPLVVCFRLSEPIDGKYTKEEPVNTAQL